MLSYEDEPIVGGVRFLALPQETERTVGSGLELHRVLSEAMVLHHKCVDASWHALPSGTPEGVRQRYAPLEAAVLVSVFKGRSWVTCTDFLAAVKCQDVEAWEHRRYLIGKWVISMFHIVMTATLGIPQGVEVIETVIWAKLRIWVRVYVGRRHGWCWNQRHVSGMGYWRHSWLDSERGWYTCRQEHQQWNGCPSHVHALSSA
jgi:hypothetical protein